MHNEDVDWESQQCAGLVNIAPCLKTSVPDDSELLMRNLNPNSALLNWDSRSAVMTLNRKQMGMIN